MKVLVIDDDDVNNFLCKKVMELCDFSKAVHTCSSVEEGMEYLKNTKTNDPDNYPDILFLDINMPIHTGWDFLDAYNNWIQDAANNSLKIFMLSSSVYEEDMSRAREHPLVSQYMTKPLSEEALMQLNDNLA
jgi:CheY-like chemotaxis protein